MNIKSKNILEVDCAVLKKFNIYSQYLCSFKQYCIVDAIAEIRRNRKNKSSIKRSIK